MTQVTRVIRINTAATSDRISLDSAATTWGELQEEMLSHPKAKLALEGDVKAIVRETRNTLESDEAILPNFDFQLFITVRKSKGGATSDKYTVMNKKELDALAKKLGIKPGSSTGNTRVKLRAFDKKSKSCPKATVDSKALAAKVEVVKEKVEPVQKAVVNSVDADVKAKMEKKAAKAKKKEKKSKKTKKNNSIDAVLKAIKAANKDVTALEDNRQPNELSKALNTF